MKTIYLLEGSIGQWEDTVTWHINAYEDKNIAEAQAETRNEIVAQVSVKLREFFEQYPEPDIFTSAANVVDDNVNAAHAAWRTQLSEIRRPLPDYGDGDLYLYDLPSYRVTEVTLLNEDDL